MIAFSWRRTQLYPACRCCRFRENRNKKNYRSKLLYVPYIANLIYKRIKSFDPSANTYDVRDFRRADDFCLKSRPFDNEFAWTSARALKSRTRMTHVLGSKGLYYAWGCRVGNILTSRVFFKNNSKSDVLEYPRGSRDLR